MMIEFVFWLSTVEDKFLKTVGEEDDDRDDLDDVAEDVNDEEDDAHTLFAKSSSCWKCL